MTTHFTLVPHDLKKMEFEEATLAIRGDVREPTTLPENNEYRRFMGARTYPVRVPSFHRIS